MPYPMKVILETYRVYLNKTSKLILFLYFRLSLFAQQGALVVMYVCVNSIYFTSFYKQGALVVMHVCVNSINLPLSTNKGR